MKITVSIYETRNGTLVGVKAIRQSGFVEGETLAGTRNHLDASRPLARRTSYRHVR